MLVSEVLFPVADGTSGFWQTAAKFNGWLMRSPEDQCHCHRAVTIEGILAPQIENTTGRDTGSQIRGLGWPRPLLLLHNRSVSPSAPSHFLHSLRGPASESQHSCFLEANPSQSLCPRHQVCCSVIWVKLKCIPTAYLVSVTSVNPAFSTYFLFTRDMLCIKHWVSFSGLLLLCLSK